MDISRTFGVRHAARLPNTLNIERGMRMSASVSIDEKGIIASAVEADLLVENGESTLDFLKRDVELLEKLVAISQADFLRDEAQRELGDAITSLCMSIKRRVAK